MAGIGRNAEHGESQHIATDGVVENQGHSGFNISYVMSVFKRLVQFKPLKPLTGEEDEWLETDYGSTQQNKRFSEVFSVKTEKPTGFTAGCSVEKTATVS